MSQCAQPVGCLGVTVGTGVDSGPRAYEAAYWLGHLDHALLCAFKMEGVFRPCSSPPPTQRVPTVPLSFRGVLGLAFLCTSWIFKMRLFSCAPGHPGLVCARRPDAHWGSRLIRARGLHPHSLY